MVLAHTHANRPALLDEILRRTPRRYRLPAKPAMPTTLLSPANRIALAIEAARRAVAYQETPSAAVRQCFFDALQRLIQEAMREEQGDPAFQAMVLQHQMPLVQEYAALASRADADRRILRAAANAIAHSAKQQRAASATKNLRQILENSARERLQRLETLEPETAVQRYLALRDRSGPRSGSEAASAQGKASKLRGAAVETQTVETLWALARRLDQAQGTQDHYRVVSSLRVPASILKGVERAKSEWDAVLLQRPSTPDTMSTAAPVWEALLLCEAKAAIDSVATDLPRLLRGLQVLAGARQDKVYAFETKQGTIHLSGASLTALDVMYCCDAPGESAARLLSASSRMQLLSTQASLEFAAALSRHGHANPQLLEPIWHELLTAARWKPVLCQYVSLHQARERAVNLNDFLATIEAR